MWNGLCENLKLPTFKRRHMYYSAARCFLILLLCVLHPTGPVTAGQNPGTCISGSVHDMNKLGFVVNDDYGRTCIFCHTPHNAQPSTPLWTRSIDNAQSGWTPYVWSAPPNKAISQIMDPLIGSSRLCMTCHDGSVALDAHGNYMPSRGVIGNVPTKDLKNTHPIGFSYDEAMNERGLLELVDKNQSLPSAIIVSGVAGVYNQVTRNSSRRVADILYQGSIVTCSSCHDVHNCGNVQPDPGHNYNYLLWAKEEQSLLCLSCHIK